MAKTALVTGASSGIGSDLARLHALLGGDLVLTARRTDRLEVLAGELSRQSGINATVIPKDLSVPGAAEEIYSEVTARDITVDYLINNAGFGNHGRFHEIDAARYEAMINLNVLALTQLTRAFLPDMIARGNGRVLNVASTAAFVPGPLQAVYFATKAYVLSLTEALAVELDGTGVTVTALCPGATETEFTKQAQLEGARLFKMGAARSADVASLGYQAMKNGRTVVIHGWKNRVLPQIVRMTPRGMVARIAKKTMEKE